MSWTMWHIYGTGFDVAAASEHRYGQFLRNHMKSLTPGDPFLAESLQEYLDQHPMGLDYEGIRELTDSGTIAEPVAYIMSEETGIYFDYPGMTDDSEEYVLFCAANPWDYNEKEKELDFSDLFDLMRDYAEELGIGMEEDVDLVYAG